MELSRFSGKCIVIIVLTFADQLTKALRACQAGSVRACWALFVSLDWRPHHAPGLGRAHLPLIALAAARFRPAAASGDAAALRGLDREIPQSSKGRRKPCGLDCGGAAPSAARS